MVTHPKTLIITGATGGLGTEICKQALVLGFEVIAVGRSKEKLSGLMGLLRNLGLEKSLSLELCDFTNLDEVVLLCKRLEKAKVSGILNIAGVRLRESYLTINGHEVHIQVNLVVPYILNRFFSSRNTDIKIANFGSSAGFRSTCRDSNDLFVINKFKKFNGPYARSKLGLAIVSRRSTGFYPKARVLTFDPGSIRTQMTTSDSFPKIFRLVAFLIFKSPKKYAQKFMYFYVNRFESIDSGSYLKKFKEKEIPEYFNQIDPAQIEDKLEHILNKAFEAYGHE